MTNDTGGKWSAGVFALLVALCLFPYLLQFPHVFDEGIMVVGAARVAHGAVPYRDFYSIYPPGGFYNLAGIFRLFGYSFLIERLWTALARIGVCLVVFAIGRRLVSARASYLPCLLTGIILLTGTCSGFEPEALFWSLVAVLLLLRCFPGNRRGWLLLSGIAAGMATLYRLDAGVWTSFSAAVTNSRARGLKNQKRAMVESSRHR